MRVHQVKERKRKENILGRRNRYANTFCIKEQEAWYIHQSNGRRMWPEHGRNVGRVTGDGAPEFGQS